MFNAKVVLIQQLAVNVMQIFIYLQETVFKGIIVLLLVNMVQEVIMDLECANVIILI